ncbi:transcription initiation factor IIF, beta subunit-domain-containing protein [Tribonema minus]|uniref:Transcription initiation factor IIF, beta subunit-domain-containing protein n=1 Tax=Tribonema minus TaxID=303371 RepID=A0A835YI82_9STRA|nr:transcription initiation factor IIF, beta subunit-domain-containing protein [Tribonema minus]
MIAPSGLVALGSNKRKKESQALLPKRKVVDDSKGCEEELGDRKVQRTMLDLSNITGEGGSVGRQMWLVKVPPAVYNAWEHVDEGGDLGRLVVKRDAAGEDVLEVQMAGITTQVSGGKKVGLPDYTLKGMRQVTDGLVFSQSAAGLRRGGGASMDATVVRSYNMQPISGQSYQKLMQNRMVAATVKQDYVRRLGDLPQKRPDGQHERHIFDVAVEEDKRRRADHIGAAVGMGGGESMGGKKIKTDRGVLRGRLFEMFGQQERWAFKELNAHLNQPDDHLKGVLREISEMHRSGPHRNQYELKAEYKTGFKNEPASSSDAHG